jgi:uncharacterized protein YaaN involved in tellurite resistance
MLSHIPFFGKKIEKKIRKSQTPKEVLNNISLALSDAEKKLVDNNTELDVVKLETKNDMKER